MKKIIFVILFVVCCQYGWASEIRNYTLNQMQLSDNTGVKEIPILGEDKKPMTLKLVIAGLGSDRVTAQGAVLSLAREHQVYSMNKPDNGTGDDGAKWYYLRYNLGVTVIRIKGDRIELHVLGDAPYTYLGTLDKWVTTANPKNN